MPRISHEKAINKIEEYLHRITQMQTMSYREGRRLREEMNISIRGFVPLAFDDGKEKVEEFDNYVNRYFVAVGQAEIPSEEQREFQQALQETVMFLTRWKEELEMTGELTSSKRNQLTMSDSKKVFIVHGHDDKSRLELENLLIRLKLEPIVLHRQPDKGRTIIEKFEKESMDAGYAFVLLTPDDECLLGDETGKRRKINRARPNVVLELGYFIGRLGREKVCTIYKEGVEIPSDITGVLYKKFNISVDELYEEIRKELATAGYELPSY